MKYSFLKNILLFLLISGCFISYGQSFKLDTIYINPINPNSNDSISVIAVVNAPTFPTRFDSVTVNIIDSNITINAYYITGVGATPSFTLDTISIGKLTPKRYKLKYNAIQKFTLKSKSDSLYFTVNQTIGINESVNPIHSIRFYPNPSGELVNLNVQLEKAITTTIRITDTQGKLVYTEQIQLNKGETIQTIATKKLSSGIYTLSLWSEEQLLSEQKLVVQH